MAKDKQEQLIQYAAQFQSALIDVITNEDNEFHVEVESDDITDMLTGMCMGFLTTIGKFTQTKGYFLDNISTVNKLIVQYLMKHGKIQ